MSMLTDNVLVKEYNKVSNYKELEIKKNVPL